MPIKDDDIDLVAEHTLAVNHMGFLSPVARRQVGLQQLKPYVLARIALGARMTKGFPRGRQAALDVVMKACEQAVGGAKRVSPQR